LTIVFAFLVFHVGQANLYERAWMHGMLTMSFTAAWGLRWLRTQAMARIRRAWVAPAALALAAALLFATTASAQAAREGDYYHVLTEEQAQDLAWIRDHVDPNGSRALVTPWEGTAFNALTGIRVYAASPFSIGGLGSGGNLSGYNSATRAQQVLNGDVSDEKFLDRFNVTLVYTGGSSVTVKAKNFTEERPGVWLREAR
jgi:hypothetical protein